MYVNTIPVCKIRELSPEGLTQTYTDAYKGFV